ncbi:DUF4287 domain-containing protein [Lacisediminihabitans changchengi]|uniref:DUF4287 domain-containing protein n=1 Tax=Lacisediminihabitans changchengi TaxID=2787634 RepID=A0A934W1I6_9MICO|nr:DUF4287 domain-containing protein [Lacisediminihabitans changchengi]MBK4346908.1 DUF4287 domain-containing protein [Lacisediminihabitans changchengi]MBK4347969.1 DUF4287 domain-containing protein [Lacisediminihabitans changchengi]
MTFQAYLDTIKAKTGLGPDDFRRLAGEKGYLTAATRPGDIIAWLQEDYGLGTGHAMAIVSVLGKHEGAGLSAGQKLEAQFTGTKARWRSTFDLLLSTLIEVGGPVSLAPTNSYISLTKPTRTGRAKVAIVAVTGDRMDVGIKLKDAAPTDRFAASGSWNSMVTHRVRLTEPDLIDDELVDWLRRAYAAA